MIHLTGDTALITKLNRLSAVMQSRLVDIAAKRLVQANQARMIAQVDADGVAFKARKTPKNKPMFERLARNLLVLSQDEQTAAIGFTGNMGIVAKQHQVGATETVTAKKGSVPIGKKATLQQAVELVRLGYRVKNRKPSTQEIQSQLSLGQAINAIHFMRAKAGISTKQQWQVHNEVRKLLGVNEADKKAILNDIITALNHENA